MAYAALADMVARFGQNELIRLTTQDGQALDTIDQVAVDRSLSDASAIINTYLRKRYQVPVAEPLPELTRAACLLARYDLAFGADTEPTEQMRLARKDIVEWLDRIREGTIVLDGAIPSGDESYAQAQDRGFLNIADDGDATGMNTGALFTSRTGWRLLWWRVLMSGALSVPLASSGPLLWMAQGLQQRLQLAFPPAYFDFAFMPSRPDRAWFKKYVRRTPAVCLGWNGVQAAGEGVVFSGVAHWTVALITKNASSPQARYAGDALAPGLFGLARVATIVLNGYLVDPDGTPWTASGSAIVTAIGNLYNEDWGDEDTAICGLDVHIAYEETLPDGLEETPSDGILVDAITWDFGEQPPQQTQTIDTAAATPGDPP